MSKRQDYWKKQGYTNEQIQNHLRFERYKAKQARERRNKNNDKNKDLIKQIKEDLLGKTFEIDKMIIKILSINPSVDGVGFWYKMNKTFRDGSDGDFREFYDFDAYSKKEFIKWLKY